MARPSLRILVLAAILASLATASSATAAPQMRGVGMHSLWLDRSFADMDRELDLAAGSGADVVRVDVGWASLEGSGKGQYTPWYVERLDRFVGGARARGMKVIVTLWQTPCWASTAPGHLKQDCQGAYWERNVGAYPPADPADYGDAAAWLAARFSADLAALEIWNEPNLPEDRFWVAPDEPAAYAALVKATYPAVKTAAPGVPVLAGALAAADAPWLEQLYAHGIKGHFDGISLHPYNSEGDPRATYEQLIRKWTFRQGIEWVREAQLAAGDQTPLWLTEFGWTTAPGNPWEVSPAAQAEYLRAAFQIAARTPYIAAATVYELRDGDTGSPRLEDNFGLVRRDFSPKPAYESVARTLGDLRGQAAGAQVAVDPAPGAPGSGGGPSSGSGSGERPGPGARSGSGNAVGARATTFKAAKLKLKLRRRGRYAYLYGTKPPRRKVALRLKGCSRRKTNGWRTVRTGRRSGKLARVGSARGFKRCRISLATAS